MERLEMEPLAQNTSAVTAAAAPTVSTLLSRRSFLTRSGYSVAALLALSLWDGTGAPPALARTGGSGGSGGMGGGRGANAGQGLRQGARLGATNVARLNLPLWGDGAHWDDSLYFMTMQASKRTGPKTYQFSDIDGDGREEMFIRGPQGLEVMQWNAVNAQWMPLPGNQSRLQDFADSAYSPPGDPYNLTIQCADIDGDGRAEILGRFADGIRIYKYDPVAQNWSGLPELLHFTDATGGASTPAYYWTIQCAPLFGAPPVGSSTPAKSQVVARGPGGLEAFDYDPASGAWTQLPTYARFSDAQDWNLYPQYWSTIQLADVDGDGNWEVVARSGTMLEIHKLSADGTTWKFLAGNSAWSDANNWNVAAQYTTIQCADIDGDGAAEILGNGIDGLETYKYDPIAKTVNYYNPTSPFLNDTAQQYGWNLPQQYATIQFADIDGDGKAEMIARASSPGLMSFKFAPSSKTWGRNLPETAVNNELSDGNGFDEIQYFATFQSARVLLPGDEDYTGDGTNKQAVVFIRGSSCVLNYRWDTGNQAWVDFQRNPPDYSSDPTLSAAYMAIAPALAYYAPNGIRSRYNDETLDPGDQITKMYFPAPNYYDTDPAARPKTILPLPSGIDAAAWEEVTWQIYWEMLWVKKVKDWFQGGDGMDGVASIINQTFGQKDNVLNQVNGYLTIPNNASVAFNIISLIGNAGWAILGMPALETGTASAIAGIIGVAAGGLGQFAGPDTYSGALSGLQNAITDGYTAALSANIATVNQIIGGTDQFGNVVPADYSLLKMFGDNITHGYWSWPDVNMVLPAERGYATQCWQTLVGVSSYIDLAYDYQFDAYHYKYTDPQSDPTYGLLATNSSGIGTPYPFATLNALFGPLNNSPTDPTVHPLDVNMDWVYRDFSHGWPALKDAEGQTPGPVGAPPPPRPAPDPHTSDIRVTPKWTRDATTGEVVVTIALANRGIQSATNVHLTSVKLGSNSKLPNTTRTHHFLRSNYTETMEVRFPSLAAGTRTVLAVRGAYKGGTFGTSLRVTIP